MVWLLAPHSLSRRATANARVLLHASLSRLQVLLDNINSAPPEAVERLNSLMEDSPTLNVYEHADGDVLSAADNTIHRNFRLFATCNPRRPHSNKLSTAFYNRVIRICLAPLDSGLTVADAGRHDLAALLRGKFAGTAGGAELAELCVSYHAAAVAVVASGKARLMPEFRLTARGLLQTAEQAKALLCAPAATVTSFTAPADGAAAANDANFVSALALALTRTYSSSVACAEEREAVLRPLIDALQQPSLRKPVYDVVAAPRDEEAANAWEAEAESLSEAAAVVQRRAGALLWWAVLMMDGMHNQAAIAIWVSG